MSETPRKVSNLTRKRKSNENEMTENGTPRKVLAEVNRGGSGLQVPGWSSRHDTTKKRTPVNSSRPVLQIDLPDDTIDAIAETVFGNLADREALKQGLLKRSKPEQKLFGYAKQYLDCETKRLAQGIRDAFVTRDMFIDSCKEHETRLRNGVSAAQSRLEGISKIENDCKSKVEKSEKQVAALRANKSLMQNELAQLTTKVKVYESNEELHESQLKGLRSKCEKLKESLDTTQKQLREKEDNFLKLELELKEAKKGLEVAQNSLEDAKTRQEATLKTLAESHARELERAQGESVDWKRRALAAEMLSENIKSESDELKKKELTASENLARLKQSNESLTGQLQNMEAQLKQKDSHLDKTLETFQQNQVFSQERIAVLSEEKGKMDARIVELSSSKAELEVTQAKLEGSLKEAVELNRTLETENVEKRGKLEELSSRFEALELASKEHTAKLEHAERESATKSVKIQELTATLHAMETAAAEKEALAAEMDTKIRDLEVKNESLESEVQAVKSTYSQAGISNNEQLEKLCKVSKEAEMLKRQVSSLDDLHNKLAEMQRQLSIAERQLFEADKAKRELHNEVQSLKGKVRVVARVRPRFQAIGENETSKLECHVDNTSLSVHTEHEQSHGTKVRKHDFAFDRVFVQKTQQAEVFDEVASFVQSALDGYNVCLFSYGQTGSGKTYTMTGDHESEVHRGIIPRAIDHIMSHKYELRAKGWEFHLEATFVEIYNESIRDLLSSSNSEKLDVRDSKKEINIPNATRQPIETESHIHRVLQLAEKNRSVAATDVNLHSSRSHSVFTLFIKGVNHEFGAQVVGSLSMCDLAGSERISRSNATGDRLKEAQSINKSLSSLADVFAALSKKSSHVPYRNSKLTHMLQPCFAGEGKTMMIVNLSSDQVDAPETLCSLRFANKVHNTELGRYYAKIHTL
eukprot:CAMPEP_0203759928 /NCGR_PEP_ID=MMETSP0098-20131031/13260_1 /ASSEMBLY_ACC=CAM_ASM_000208 /TAXON_ID=96639 /ORGANISM=" , Strain NY0313808BC1" /LENGTH=926 /DNA_ID=CAMNT_0050653253 /DNA_START=219 /DNA_END=2999 /DNA_ORIENTATION=+